MAGEPFVKEISRRDLIPFALRERQVFGSLFWPPKIARDFRMILLGLQLASFGGCNMLTV